MQENVYFQKLKIKSTNLYFPVCRMRCTFWIYISHSTAAAHTSLAMQHRKSDNAECKKRKKEKKKYKFRFFCFAEQKTRKKAMKIYIFFVNWKCNMERSISAVFCVRRWGNGGRRWKWPEVGPVPVPVQMWNSFYPPRNVIISERNKHHLIYVVFFSLWILINLKRASLAGRVRTVWKVSARGEGAGVVWKTRLHVWITTCRRHGLILITSE